MRASTGSDGSRYGGRACALAPETEDETTRAARASAGPARVRDRRRIRSFSFYSTLKPLTTIRGASPRASARSTSVRIVRRSPGIRAT